MKMFKLKELIKKYIKLFVLKITVPKQQTLCWRKEEI